MGASKLEVLRTELKNREDQIIELQKEYDGKRFPDNERERFNRLNEEIEQYKTDVELEVRRMRVEELSGTDSIERIEVPQVFSAGRVRDEDLHRIETVKHDALDPSVAGRDLRDRAKRVIERAEWVDGRISTEDAQGRAEYLLNNVDTEDGRLARHMLVTGAPEYKRGFRKYLSGSYLTHEESRAMEIARAASLTGTAGGFAVPYELDPSIIPTSNLAINPYRAISRVVNITVDEWRGVSSSGVTAAYAAEATAATDAAPTLAQPTISTEKARAFIPFSIEIGQDWGSFQAEMGGLLQDSKDELEATKFTLGNGTNEPFGVVTGATTVYTAAGTSTITLADIYGWQASLGPRFRARSTFVTHLATANRIRQFDTAGGAGIWIDTLKSGLASEGVPSPGAFAANLLGRPAYESTAISSTYTTGQLIGVYGDFNYYVIVDRIGMNIEVIPHLFDVTNNMPTGQRGLYAYWRNGAKVVDANAFRTLKLA